MLQGFFTLHRIKEESEVSTRLVDHPITLWPRQGSQTTLWEPLGPAVDAHPEQVVLLRC